MKANYPNYLKRIVVQSFTCVGHIGYQLTREVYLKDFCSPKKLLEQFWGKKYGFKGYYIEELIEEESEYGNWPIYKFRYRLVTNSNQLSRFDLYLRLLEGDRIIFTNEI